MIYFCVESGIIGLYENGEGVEYMDFELNFGNQVPDQGSDKDNGQASGRVEGTDSDRGVNEDSVERDRGGDVSSFNFDLRMSSMDSSNMSSSNHTSTEDGSFSGFSEWVSVVSGLGDCVGEDERSVIVLGRLEDELAWSKLYVALEDVLAESGVRLERLGDVQLDLSIGEHFLNDVTRLWTTVMKVKNVTDKQIVDLTYRYMMDPLVSREVDAEVRKYLEGYIGRLRGKYTNLEMVKNHYVKMLHWVEVYVDRMIGAGGEVVLVHDRGFKASEIEFLNLLVSLGVRVVVFDSLKTGKRDGFGKVIELSDRGEFIVWSREEIERRDVKRQDTVAKAAHDEIRNLLHRDSEGLYAPWQFEEYRIENVMLNTTYEEIYLYWDEGVQMRPGFAVSSERVKRGDRMYEGSLSIPNMFVKVRGVPEHVEKYWADFEHLREGRIVSVKDRFPFTRSVYVHRRGIVLKDGKFPVEDVKRMSEYGFGHIRGSMQDLMIEKMNEMISDRNWLVEKYRDDYDMAFRILHNVLSLDREYVEMLQKYDFGGSIPKLVVFDGDESVASVDDVIVMMFLYRMGFDVVVMTPTGYENIEGVMNKEYVDVHKLARFEMGLSVPEVTVRDVSEESGRRGGLFKRLFD